MKTNIIIIASFLILLIVSCKKETVLEENKKNTPNLPNDYKTMNMVMRYGNEILNYTAKYSPSQNTGTYEGKDVKRFLELNNKYQESVAIFTGENEFTFYKDKNAFIREIAKINKGKKINTNNYSSQTQTFQVIDTRIEFYQDIDYLNLLKSFDVFNYQINITQPSVTIDEAPHLSFKYYYPLGDGTDNWWPTTSTVITPTIYNTPGVKQPSLGTDNDKYSSLKVITVSNNTYTYNTNNTPVSYLNFLLVCFQDTNYGGKAIGFLKPNTINPNIEVNNLKQKRFGSVGLFQTNKTWNDSFSSYYAFYY